MSDKRKIMISAFRKWQRRTFLKWSTKDVGGFTTRMAEARCTAKTVSKGIYVCEMTQVWNNNDNLGKLSLHKNKP